MKIHLRSAKRSVEGGVLLVTVVLLVFAALFLSTYFLMTQNEYTTVVRSQTWNGSLALAEAGVEDALAVLNKYQGTNTALTNWSLTAVSQDNWTTSGNVYYMHRLVDPNLGYYDVYITNSPGGTNPVIMSIGTAYWNLRGPSAGGGGNTLLPDGGVAASYASNTVRKVFVKTKADANSTGGLLSWTSMDFHGNDATVDSFDSSDPTKSAWQTTMFFNGINYGTYTNTLRTAQAVVGTDGSIVNVGNANIFGYVDTGPGGSVGINANGTVGDLAWAGADTPGVQPGHQKDDMNVVFNDVVLPIPTNTYNPITPTWLPVTARSGSKTIMGQTVSYDVIITNMFVRQVVGGVTNWVSQPGGTNNPIFYAMDQLWHQSILISASNVVLYLTNGITLRSSDGIFLDTDSNVKIYTGASIDAGNGAVNNFTKYAPPFKIYGLPGCTSISFGGNATLTAWINAPEASVNFNGGGCPTCNYDVVGSFLVHDVQVNGHYNFHFDEVLKFTEPPYRFVATSWKEVN